MFGSRSDRTDGAQGVNRMAEQRSPGLRPLAPQPRPARSPLRRLYVQVLIAIAVCILLGHFYPSLGVKMKPFSDGFILLIRGRFSFTGRHAMNGGCLGSCAGPALQMESFSSILSFPEFASNHGGRVKRRTVQLIF